MTPADRRRSRDLQSARVAHIVSMPTRYIIIAVLCFAPAPARAADEPRAKHIPPTCYVTKVCSGTVCDYECLPWPGPVKLCTPLTSEPGCPEPPDCSGPEGDGDCGSIWTRLLSFLGL